MSWSELKFKDRAALIKLGVKHGYRDIDSIKEMYNTYADGGPTKETSYSAGHLMDAIYENSKVEGDNKPWHNYDFTQSEEWADAHGYYPDERGHRDDRVKKSTHPTHPSRGTWKGSYQFDLSDEGMKDPNHTIFGVADNNQDPQATITYNGSTVLPEFTATPKGNYIYNSYDDLRIHKYSNGGNIFAGGGAAGYAQAASTAMSLASNATNQANNVTDITSALGAVQAKGAQFGAQHQYDDFDTLMNAHQQMRTMNHVSASDLRNNSFFADFGNSVSASAQGASAGQNVGGPWGAAIGGIVGGVSSVVGSLFGRAKARRQARQLNSAIDDANVRQVNDYNNQMNNIALEQANNMAANYSAHGGMLDVFNHYNKYDGKTESTQQMNTVDSMYNYITSSPEIMNRVFGSQGEVPYLTTVGGDSMYMGDKVVARIASDIVNDKGGFDAGTLNEVTVYPDRNSKELKRKTNELFLEFR